MCIKIFVSFIFAKLPQTWNAKIKYEKFSIFEHCSAITYSALINSLVDLQF